MGYAIAEAAAKAGHEVTLISGPVSIVPPGEGWLACRTRGAGRMAEPDQIAEQVIEILKKAEPKNAR